MDDTVDLPWPKPGSSIRNVFDPGHRCAQLKWAQGRAYGYEQGYLRAANLVFEHIDDTVTWMDSLVFPLAFLWRHAIELQLKRIIVDGARLRGVEPQKHFHHDLVELWRLAKIEIVALDGVEPAGAETVETILGELQALDPFASGFRFPVDKNLKPNLASPPDQLDLPNFHAICTSVHTFLECGVMEINHRLNYIGEMESKMAKLYHD